jgi:dipeptidyl aminopeptidase/acylaminoacyl peptidase
MLQRRHTIIRSMGKITISALLSICVASASQAAGRPITVNDVLSMERLSEPQLSPDGTRAVYTVAVPDLAANRLARNIWLVSLKTGEARPLTTTGRDGGAKWSPDGRRIAFISQRDGTSQLYILAVDTSAPTSAEPAGLTKLTKLTGLSGGADNIVWSPDGQTIAFTSEVYPDCRDDRCNVGRDEAREKNPVRARIYDALLYRHWTAWSEGKRLHLFVVPAAGGAARDLLPGAAYDVPPPQREGPHPIAFAPDNRTICFTAITDRVEATSTNGDLFEVDATGPGAMPKKMTSGPGFDGAPAYSPDGRTILYRSQARAGYEADKWRLMLLDRASGRHTSLTDGFDRSVEDARWSGDGKTIYFNAEDQGQMPVFTIAASGGKPRAITAGMFDGEFDIAADALVVARSRVSSPTELFQVNRASGMATPLTRNNAARLSALDLAKSEPFTFAGAGGTPIHGMLVKPPSFDSSRKYPVVMLLHGGPQTQFGDTWSYRWNAEMFAAPGYVVVMINRRGSTGAGQQFVDDITGDWGGKPMEDLMKGLDFVLQKYPFTDSQRVAAAGASYGGYMIDWLASQSKGRFRALVSHAGVYDLASMYGSTEELWFPEHDFGGTPWTNPKAYQQMSPSSYAADFGKYKTPTLVICGEQDYRVPYTQSLEFYTALQRQDVPSKLIVFPDEGHWILKPQNSALWYKEVLGFLGEHLR